MSRYKPYPEYKDSGVEWIGEVPAHWEVKRLKHVGEIVSGGTPKSGEPKFWDDDGVEWFTPADLSEGMVTRLGSSRRKLSPEGIKSCGADESPAGSIVISIRAPVGNIGMLSESGATNQGCKTLVPQRMDRSPVIASTLSIATPDLQSEANGTTFQELSGTNLSAFSIPWPPIQESDAIATFLDRETTRIDTLIEKKQRFIELLEEKRQAVITHAVTKGLDPNVPMKDSGVEWIGEVPAHWKKCQLKNLAAVCNGRDYKTVEDPNGQYPVIGSGGQFAWASECLYDGESVLFGRKGTVDKPLYINGPFWTVDTMFYTSLSKRAIGKYVYYVATIIPYDSISTNTALPSMTQEDLSSLNLTVPDTAEQSQITTFLDRETARIDALIEKTSESIELLKERRSSLVTAAVTGKIDVRQEAG